MEISLKLDENEKINLLASLGQKPSNYVLLSQGADGLISISHKIVYPHEFLKLFRVVLEGDYVEELMEQIPQEILAIALEQNEKREMDDMDLDTPAILPSEVLNQEDD